MLAYTATLIRHWLEDRSRRVRWRPKAGARRVLVVQREGIGNSILTTPLIQALALLEPRRVIDVLIDGQRGTKFVFEDWDVVGAIYDASRPRQQVERVHYEHVLECHPRKPLPRCYMFRERRALSLAGDPKLEYHWRFDRHESEVLLDYARALGFHGASPTVRPVPTTLEGVEAPPANAVAIGIGYLKGRRANGRDWSDRHWGNKNFVRLCQMLRGEGFTPVVVGNREDLEETQFPLAVANADSICGRYSLRQVAHYISRCLAFVGNDTGLMHVAACLGVATVGVFVTTNSVKSHPLGPRTRVLGGDRGPARYDVEPTAVLAALYSLLRTS